MLRDVFRQVRQAKHERKTFLRVWLIPQSDQALKAIQRLEGVSATDATNRALQAYARSLAPRDRGVR